MTPSDLAAIEARFNAPYDATYPAVLSEAERRHDVSMLLAEVRRLQSSNDAQLEALRLLRAEARDLRFERDRLHERIDQLNRDLDRDAEYWAPYMREGDEVDERRAPVQGELGRGRRAAGTIAWSEHQTAWEAYAKRYGRGQSAELIAERHGFGYAELTELLGHEPVTWKPAK